MSDIHAGLTDVELVVERSPSLEAGGCSDLGETFQKSIVRRDNGRIADAANPLFAPTAAGDYRLLFRSPLIDAGASVLADIEFVDRSVPAPHCCPAPAG